jgi:hypothetical protein
MKEQDNLKRIKVCSGKAYLDNWHFECDGKELKTISKARIAERFPIQIVEDMGSDFLFIVLLKDINFKKKYYANIPSLSRRKDGSWAIILKSGYKDDAHFSDNDVIRNPTTSELKYIKETFIKCGLRFNRKTNEIVMVDEEKYNAAFNATFKTY